MCTLQKKFLLLAEVEAGGRCRIQNWKIGQKFPRTKPNSKICFPPWAVSPHLVTCTTLSLPWMAFVGGGGCVEVGLRVAMDVEDGVLGVRRRGDVRGRGVVDVEEVRGLKTIMKLVNVAGQIFCIQIFNCRSKYSHWIFQHNLKHSNNFKVFTVGQKRLKTSIGFHLKRCQNYFNLTDWNFFKIFKKNWPIGWNFSLKMTDWNLTGFHGKHNKISGQLMWHQLAGWSMKIFKMIS